jgi:steroid delta-isomerase-like uncharacterized protein
MRKAPILLATGLAVLLIGCAPDSGAQLETNKEIVRRFGEISNAADWEALPEVMADAFRRHSAATEGPPVTSRDQFIELQRQFLVSFPDQRVTTHEVVAEGDLVAVRATYSATNTGPMGDIPATGQAFEAPFLAIFRIENGKIAELWVEWDNVAMLRQMGLFPPPPAAGQPE